MDTSVSTSIYGEFDINFTLNLADGAPNGWTVVMTTNYKLTSVSVSVTRFYMGFTLLPPIEPFLYDDIYQG